MADAKVTVDKFRLDIANQPTRVGDIVVITKGGYRGHAARIAVGRVVRLTPKSIAVRLCVFGHKTWEERANPAYWFVSDNDTVIMAGRYFRITMHSVPPELFALLDNLEIG